MKPKGSKSMDFTTWILVAVATILFAVAFWRGRDLPLAGLRAAGRALWRSLPMLLLGMVIAGLAQVLTPKELISQWLGTESGTKSVVVGCIVGGLAPGGAYATFPLVAVLYRAGASVGAVVGFVTAWALWSVSRLPVEIALIDSKPTLIRYAVTFAVPPFAGMLANAVAKVLG